MHDEKRNIAVAANDSFIWMDFYTIDWKDFQGCRRIVPDCSGVGW